MKTDVAIATHRLAPPLAALALLAGALCLTGSSSEQAAPARTPPQREREAPLHSVRELRYPLVAFRSESPGRVETSGSWWPEWMDRPEGRRRVLFAEPGGRLRFRIGEFRGGRFEGELTAHAQIEADRLSTARCVVSVQSAGVRRQLFDAIVPAGAVVPFALALPADVGSDAVLELSAQVGDLSPGFANAGWIDPVLRKLVPRERMPASDAPSILLITADTVRQDELGPYGGATRTPALAGLAAAGTTFLDVHSVAFGTTPSHASIMTSRPAVEHGVYDNDNVLGEESETLAEALRGAGYSTAAFVSAAPLARSLGFAQGFDSYSDSFPLDPAVGEGSYQERRAEDTVSRVILWLALHGDEQFFVWVHFYDPHQPYEPPAGWADPYLSSRARLAYPVGPDGRAGFLDGAALAAGGPARLRAIAALARARYRGEIAYLDAQVARVLHAVEATGQKDPIVVFAADHGENFLEHEPELAFAHDGLHAEVTRLPLIVAAPGRVPAGVRRAGLGASLDIAPTVLALAGVPAPAGWRGRSLFGAAPREAIVLESAARQEIAVRSARWLYRVRPAAPGDPNATVSWTAPGRRFELYDLAADPGERANVYRAGHPALARLAARVEPYRRPPVMAARLGSEPHAAALRALGYVR